MMPGMCPTCSKTHYLPFCAGLLALLIGVVAIAEEPPAPRVHAAPRALPAGATTSDWPHALGPGYNNSSPETGLIDRWPTDGPTLVWEVQTGTGTAPPVVADGQLVLFHSIDGGERVECRDAETGKLRWYYDVPIEQTASPPPPAASPVIADGHVFVWDAIGNLICLKLDDGQLAWRYDASEQLGGINPAAGAAAPLVAEGLVFVTIGRAKDVTFVALDTATGIEVWRTTTGISAGSAAPIVGEFYGIRRFLTLIGSAPKRSDGGLVSVDPHTGNLDLFFPFRGPPPAPINCTSPVIHKNRVLCSNGGMGTACLDFMPNSGMSRAWQTTDLRSYRTTPIYRDECVFGIDGVERDKTALVALTWRFGEKLWRETPKLPGDAALGFGRMIAADGRFWILTDRGGLLQARLTKRGLDQRQFARLFDGESDSPPALSRGLLYVRQTGATANDTRLRCFDLRGDAATSQPTSQPTSSPIP